MSTATGLRISSVNGTAFLDNCPADIIAAVGIGAQVKIYDSSSRYLQGVIDSVGSSEGLGSDLLNGFNFTSGWGAVASTITGANSFTVNTDYYSYLESQNNLIPLLGLIKGTLIATDSAGQTQQKYGDSIYLANGDTDKYFTNYGSARVVLGSYVVTSIHTITTWTNYQVTAPSSSGVIIKDLSGNQNFVSKDASFTYNAASYTYEIIAGHPAIKRFGGVPFCTQRVNIW